MYNSERDGISYKDILFRVIFMKIRPIIKRKCWLYFQSQLLLIVSLMARLFYLMVFDAEHYQKLAKDLHERERKIKAARGEDPGP